MSLEDYGWDESWAARFASLDLGAGVPARVISGHRDSYHVHTGEEDISVQAAGKLYHKPFTRSDLPAVGDWVIVEGSTIKGVLPRKSTFSRKFSGKTSREQIMATNLDTVWVVSTFEADFNPARIERYVTLVLESGAAPVIVLAKSDLVEDTVTSIAILEERIPGVSVHAVSAKTKTGLNALKTYLLTGHTIALLGSSGVGKSTLINHFFGRDILHTALVREKDGKGRHTTTHRELILLPSGSLLLDTPGMRELQLWSDDDALEKGFSDIEEIAAQCRFSDCKHESEPGCAVIKAAENGALPQERFQNYKKLTSELSFLERKTDSRANLQEKKKWKGISKERRRLSQEHKKKNKNKNKG